MFFFRNIFWKYMTNPGEDCLPKRIPTSFSKLQLCKKNLTQSFKQIQFCRRSSSSCILWAFIPSNTGTGNYRIIKLLAELPPYRQKVYSDFEKRLKKSWNQSVKKMTNMIRQKKFIRVLCSFWKNRF